MQPDQVRGRYASRRKPGDDSPLAVSSRRDALELLRAAVENGRAGPVLITGEPGAGKTWLAHRLAAVLPADWRALHVDLATAMNALEFLRLIGHALGVAVTNRLGAARLALHDVLQDEATDGRRWLLVVDEAHRGSPWVWDEIQTIANQLPQPPGFVALILLGQTELARALSTRSRNGLAARLSLHLHLMPLDLDEARDLFGYTGHTDLALERALEELHRDASGNPGKFLRLARSRPELARPGSDRDQSRQLHVQNRMASAQLTSPTEQRGLEDEEPVSNPSLEEDDTVTARSNTPSLIPTRPPIRDEDGLVEVGWEGDLESELVPAARDSTEPVVSSADDPSFNEEMIEDRYAALQAWSEWTRNQGRSTAESPADRSARPRRAPAGTTGSEPADADPANPYGSAGSFDPATDTGQASAADSPAAVPPAGVRAESQHEFAPYSHLFTRLRQSRQG